jgi:lipoprotein-anchoring transpeptidase ErfK/SrfK
MGIVMHTISLLRSAAAAVVFAAASFASTAFAAPFLPFGQPSQPPMMQAPVDEGTDDSAELSPRFKRQIVDYRTNELPGTIVIDTPNTYLYLVLGNGKAMRYGIGVGREGFTWSGVQNITKKAEWPDWTPPPEMIERQPYLPRFMAGGPGNPLGARAMYLGGSVYRIHGTNDPSTIGKRVSSGCIRLTNEDVSDLFSRVNVGTKVVVMPMIDRRASAGTSGIY